MKKLIALLLVLAMMLTLPGCKNKAVKNVEELITAIGEVTLESGEAISAARTAYDALTEKEVEKVENYALLTEAEATLTALEEEKARLEAEHAAVCEWLVGDWVNLNVMARELCTNSAEFETATETAKNEGVSFAEDDTAMLCGEKTVWVYKDGVVSIDNTEIIRNEEHGFLLLSIGEQSYVKEENLHNIFVSVELTEENVDDYIELAEMPFEVYDSFGEVFVFSNGVEASFNWVWLASRMYSEGLVYIGANNLTIEVVSSHDLYENTFNNTQSAFGAMGDTVSAGYCFMSGVPSAENCSIRRVKGTLYFVNSEYSTVTVSDGVRKIEIFGTYDDDEFFVEGEEGSLLEEGLLYY